ncbi:MAG TPA: DNA-3-methyladenine glycosylase 2 family protein [Candidatus Pelagibacter sp.]|jgi:DNA-3-methyladenine glycosylase II|nr:DNA-3-methyladenine glycosylase 2 family protein [Candidatus Pelagibacter sp.]
MKKPPAYWHKAKKILSKRDPVIRKIIKRYKKDFLATRNNPFFSLCRTIVGQQVSVASADSIWSKFTKKCKKNIRPEVVLKIPSRVLKSAGLSRQKISYLKIISKAFENKSFNVREIKKMNDADAIEYITKLKGLGVWSAEMFLMFNLNRPDIFPVKDIGLLRAISKNYKVSYPPSNRFLEKISKLHSGYRTVFTWHMWRSIDPTDVEY